MLFFVYGGCTFRLDPGVQPPKAGSLLFCRHLGARPGERVLDLGSGAGVAAVLAARAGARVVATDIRPEAVACTRANAARNGVSVDAREGDGFAPCESSPSISSARARPRCRPRPASIGTTRRPPPTMAGPTAGRCSSG